MRSGLPTLASQVLHEVTAYKLLFERTAAVSSDAIHVLVGAVLHLLIAAVLRSSVASWRPLAAVAVAQIANELLDFHYDIWPDHVRQVGESIKDCLLTLAVPVMLMVTVRIAPGLFGKAPGRGSADETGLP
jgi:hypothetical protein